MRNDELKAASLYTFIIPHSSFIISSAGVKAGTGRKAVRLRRAAVSS
jgi:hypothetical protein